MQMIISILEGFLGDIRTHSDHRSQITFDCPACAIDKDKPYGDGKGNLSINYEHNLFKCWSCWDRNNMKGSIHYLLKRYGNKQLLKDYILLRPIDYVKNIGVSTEIPILPEEYQELSGLKTNSITINKYFKYLRDRGLGDYEINRYKLGICLKGKYKGRIIIPSYDTNNRLNYFVTRAIETSTKPKYLNPSEGKDNLIFNEYLLNWESDIYLVEGVFDHMVIPNSIPILGKYINDTLLINLIKRAKKDVIICLDGGELEDADTEVIYKRLNTSKLTGRVKICRPPERYDFSEINQKFGNKGIIKILKTSNKPNESTFY
jgi:hypothetical protein